MTCKHSRHRYAAALARKSDDQIKRQVESNRNHFAQYHHMHYMQHWRQCYEAEARKRGLM